MIFAKPHHYRLFRHYENSPVTAFIKAIGLRVGFSVYFSPRWKRRQG
jgi:hypothetical protein